MTIPWDVLLASALYSFVATSWRREAQHPGGIPSAWFVAGTASIGGIALLVLIAFKVTWWFLLLCIGASFAGQIFLYPVLDAPLRSGVGLRVGAIALLAIGTYMVLRIA